LLVRVCKLAFSHPRVYERFQGRDTLLDRALSLVQQCQSELGEVLLNGHHPGFQTGKSLDQIHLSCRGNRERSNCMRRNCLVGG
jgi:hypothetical protein